jgi:hypothetical protein
MSNFYAPDHLHRFVEEGVDLLAGNPGSWNGEGYHTGVDFYAIDFNRCDPSGKLIEDLGMKLFSPADGVILSNYIDGNGGIGVIIDLGNGYTFRLHHLEFRCGLPVGHVVKAGDEIGLCGSTGLSNGPHVHAVLYYGGISTIMAFGEGPLHNGSIVHSGDWSTGMPEETHERLFPETGHKIIWGFKCFWEGRGGLDIFGFPLTDELVEDGMTIQFFERAVFEYHPEHKGTPYEVQLRQLGRAALEAKAA